jgi:DSF synthase
MGASRKPLEAHPARMEREIPMWSEDGRGEQAVRDYIAHHRRHHSVHRCIRDVSMRVNPLLPEELLDIADIWAEHAMRLEELDLRK